MLYGFVLERLCRTATRAHYAGREKSRQPWSWARWNGANRVWQRAGRQQIAVYLWSDRLAWDLNFLLVRNPLGRSLHCEFNNKSNCKSNDDELVTGAFWTESRLLDSSWFNFRGTPERLISVRCGCLYAPIHLEWLAGKVLVISWCCCAKLRERRWTPSFLSDWESCDNQ